MPFTVFPRVIQREAIMIGKRSVCFSKRNAFLIPPVFYRFQLAMQDIPAVWAWSHSSTPSAASTGFTASSAIPRHIRWTGSSDQSGSCSHCGHFWQIHSSSLLLGCSYLTLCVCKKYGQIAHTALSKLLTTLSIYLNPHTSRLKPTTFKSPAATRISPLIRDDATSPHYLIVAFMSMPIDPQIDLPTF